MPPKPQIMPELDSAKNVTLCRDYAPYKSTYSTYKPTYITYKPTYITYKSTYKGASSSIGRAICNYQRQLLGFLAGSRTSHVG